MGNRVVCAVFDSAIQAFGQPFFVTARAQAVRSFTDEARRAAPDNQLNAHPEDFELFAIAEWSDASGHFTNHEPELLVRGKDCVERKE